MHRYDPTITGKKALTEGGITGVVTAIAVNAMAAGRQAGPEYIPWPEEADLYVAGAVSGVAVGAIKGLRNWLKNR